MSLNEISQAILKQPLWKIQSGLFQTQFLKLSSYSSLHRHASQVSLQAHCPPVSQLHEFSSQPQSTQVHASPQHTQGVEDEPAVENATAGIANAKTKTASPAINLVNIENPIQ